MASLWKTLIAVVWKCFVLRCRNYMLTFLDIAGPLFLFYCLYYLVKIGIITDDRRPLVRHPETDILDIQSVGQIAYAPSNQQTDNIMNTAYYSGGFLFGMEEKLNEIELESWLYNKTDKYFAKTPSSYLIFGGLGVVFVDLNETEKTLIYKLRPSDGHIKTVNRDDGRYDEKVSPYVSYENNPSGVLGAQIQINSAFLKRTGLTSREMKMTVGMINESTGSNVFYMLMYLFFTLAYIFFVISLVRDIIEEKSSGIKEYMRIVGLPSWMVWTQWLIYTMLVHVPVTIAATIFFSVLNPHIFPGSSFILWLLMFIFTITCTFLLFILTCFFNGPTLGTTVSVALWLVVHVTALIYLFDTSKFGKTIQMVICLIPLHNLVWGLETIHSFHKSGTVWGISHLFEIGESGSNISIGLSIIISVLEICVLIIILIYLDGIMPGKYGVAKPLNFMCQWCYGSINNSENLALQQAPLPKIYESPPKNMKVGITIRGLKKVYGTSKQIVAVERVDLDIYEGEIMALLGHNGAGKTTTMSMLTGMSTPTSGMILFDGKDISKDHSYRDNLGLCTQHDLYFPKLTVIEHLIFFGILRGMSYKEAKYGGKELLTLLNIKEKCNDKAHTLSGGMKRRLCLAISLVGSPKFLILDEPTSGLDPENRRKIWNIILALRGRRTILITTHFMEEADVLGDRIAIMDHGNVVCCGTTLFVKRLYGTGYQLHLLVEPHISRSNIYDLIQMHVPNFQVLTVHPTQINIALNESDVKYFPGVLQALETKKSSLGITGISITCTSMEDVFLNVAKKSSNHDAVSNQSSKTRIQSSTSRLAVGETDFCGLFCQRWNVLFMKNVTYRIHKIIQLVFTVAVTGLAVWSVIQSVMVKTVELEPQPPLKMNLALYSNSYNLLVHDGESIGLAATIKKLIKGQESDVEVLPLNTNIEEYLHKLSDSDFPTFSRFLLFINITKDRFNIQYRPRYHIAPVIIDLMTNTVLKHASVDERGTIKTIIHPYVPTGFKCDEYSPYAIYIMVVSITFIFSWILAIFTSLVTEERVNGFKQQQYLAGVSPLLYWCANFSFDYCLYILIILLYLIIILITGGIEFLLSEWFYVLVLVFILLGLSGIFFVYLYSYFIDSPNVSFNVFILCGTLFTFFPILWFEDIHSFTLYMFINCLLCLNPLFPFMKCVYFLSNRMSSSFLCYSCNLMCEEVSKPLFKMITKDDTNRILPFIIFLALTWIVYLCIILLIDYQLYWKILSCVSYHSSNSSESRDNDVLDEAHRVKELNETNDSSLPLRVQWLKKTYILGPKAVRNVSFALLPGECFGLLGVNGAGKSTTFKMLIGEIFPNCGNAFLHGASVIQSGLRYRSQIGYCPQHDAFPQYLTGEQVMMIVAQLKGIPKNHALREIYRWFDLMGIREHAKKKTGSYSGGTKRKLSTAMAFIGHPVVVFLDEPTTGVDPEARRRLWTVMQAQQKRGQAIVLTSHSMEECEALCTRLTIMRKGEMMCIGTPEYLKIKFSQGYTVLVKLKDPTYDKVRLFKADFRKYCPDIVIKDEHHSLINYQVSDPKLPLSQIFSIVLWLKDGHDVVEDFSISNTTLEQLFMSFATR